MNQIAVTRYPCKFHPNYSIEYLCVAKSCYYSSILYNSYTSSQDLTQCQSRLSCIKCIENCHTFQCGQTCYIPINQATFQMPHNYNHICQKVLDMSQQNRNLIENIDTLFDQLKVQFLKKLDSEKKSIIKDITLLNTDILDFSHRLMKKWNFSNIYSKWISEVDHTDIQNIEKFSEHLEERIQKCHELTENISKQYKDSSTSFQIFTNVEQQIQEIKEKIHNMFDNFDLQKKSELCKSQDFKLITMCKNIDISPDAEGFQIIRNSQQSYFDCFSPEDIIPDKTYQILFSFDKVPCTSVNIGLVNSEGINNSRLEKKISQSLVYSYSRHMGNVVKGQPLYNVIKANEIYKVVINLSKNIFYISDEQESNIISVDKNYSLLQGKQIEKYSEEIANYSQQKCQESYIKWRIFISLNEPVMNIKIIKTIKY